MSQQARVALLSYMDVRMYVRGGTEMPGSSQFFLQRSRQEVHHLPVLGIENLEVKLLYPGLEPLVYLPTNSFTVPRKAPLPLSISIAASAPPAILNNSAWREAFSFNSRVFSPMRKVPICETSTLLPPRFESKTVLSFL